MTSQANGSTVSRTGVTLVGRITDPATVRSLSAQIVGATTSQSTIGVDATSGQFAYRLFEETVGTGANVSVRFRLERTSGAVEEPTFTFAAANDETGVNIALSRMTFGATPALVSRVKQMGFAAYVNEQLAPASINDSGFAALDTTGLQIAVYPNQTLNPYNFEDNIQSVKFATAAYSEKQLQEVMAHFWDNHFWSVREDAFEASIGGKDEFDTYRRLAFGTFRDLLVASAKNGVMMDYLDNDGSRRNAVNENYARELLELHTVGVNGGYGNADVAAVARILTGWSQESFDDPRFDTGNVKDNVRFVFKSSNHDTGDKLVPFLNRTFTGRTGDDGVREGEELLDALANHPKTQEYICGKLVTMLVADQTPASFVTLCTSTWAQTGGNIGSILRAILTSPAFRTTVEYRNAKVKTPFEYSVGFARNFNVRPNTNRRLDFYYRMRNLNNEAGMNFQNYPVPTGFAEDSQSWLGAASLLSRMRNINSLLGSTDLYTADFQALLVNANATTAEAAAAFLLGLGTGDRFRQDEFDAVVRILKGTDGKLDLGTSQLSKIRGAIGLIVSLPSYQLQ
jgi:uncharacterized protein (DUF1800 family)